MNTRLQSWNNYLNFGIPNPLFVVLLRVDGNSKHRLNECSFAHGQPMHCRTIENGINIAHDSYELPPSACEPNHAAEMHQESKYSNPRPSKASYIFLDPSIVRLRKGFRPFHSYFDLQVNMSPSTSS